MISADLGRQLKAFVTRLVETGRYGSKNEGFREGVTLIQDREAQLAALDTVVGRALADSDAGMGKPADEVFDRLDAKYRAMASARK
jgi:antitoxin ParD1/3/4